MSKASRMNKEAFFIITKTHTNTMFMRSFVQNADREGFEPACDFSHTDQ